MHAKLIRPRYGLPAGTDGEWNAIHDNKTYRYTFRLDGVKYEVVPAKDIRIDAPLHLYNNHDDIISACYWADRILSPELPRRVYQTHKGYAVRVLRHPEADVLLTQDSEYDDYFTARYDWSVVASWHPKPRGQFSIGGKWDFHYLRSNTDLDADRYHLCSDDDTTHILEMLHYDKIETYEEHITNAIVIVGDGEYDEIWLTGLGTTYFRVK